ncbi:carboxypeptidase-like regulatory domain-containing protein [Gemmatimonas groenlandica]|uniref:Carboxypeptidase regulatory-like domain-containing protein n=1 Tax=Gemmatimonas groenlandica TaxID=2732249 RepID=A0A6M4IHX4_9BACT|nr:carboxypeptidase-like regulatory domain-containing protein [Gemmatimonas groenlandica]QJR34704.1 carboxypeptidase regulatory-like domain-containing protein [Gemmatimonas groenlandica]
MKAAAGLALLMGGCDMANCVAMPCPLPIAVEGVVTNAAGGPLPGLFVDVVAPFTTRVSCDATTGRCVVPGNAGNYTLRFGATGYQTVERSVSVARVRATTDCGCDAATTQQVSLTLVPL